MVRVIHDNDLKTLGKLPKLESLQMHTRDKNRGVTDKGISYLAGSKSLTYINVTAGPSLTNDGLAHIAQMKKLQRLSIRGLGHITDEGLRHLEKLKTLESVYLCSQNDISNKAIRRLQSQLPNLISLKIVPVTTEKP